MMCFYSISKIMHLFPTGLLLNVFLQLRASVKRCDRGSFASKLLPNAAHFFLGGQTINHFYSLLVFLMKLFVEQSTP